MLFLWFIFGFTHVQVLAEDTAGYLGVTGPCESNSLKIMHPIQNIGQNGGTIPAI